MSDTTKVIVELGKQLNVDTIKDDVGEFKALSDMQGEGDDLMISATLIGTVKKVKKFTIDKLR